MEILITYLTGAEKFIQMSFAEEDLILFLHKFKNIKYF